MKFATVACDVHNSPTNVEDYNSQVVDQLLESNAAVAVAVSYAFAFAAYAIAVVAVDLSVPVAASRAMVVDSTDSDSAELVVALVDSQPHSDVAVVLAVVISAYVAFVDDAATTVEVVAAAAAVEIYVVA